MQWMSSGELSSLQSVKDLLSQAEAQLESLQKKFLLLSGLSEGATGKEVVDSVTGFAVDLQGKGMGILQMVIVAAAELPTRRLSKNIEPYIEISATIGDRGELGLFKDVQETLCPSLVSSSDALNNESGDMRALSADAERKFSSIIEAISLKL